MQRVIHSRVSMDLAFEMMTSLAGVGRALQVPPLSLVGRNDTVQAIG